MMDDKRIEKALDFAWCYGQIDGCHHKMWVIDQMVHALLGEEEYKKWEEKAPIVYRSVYESLVD